MSAGFIAGSDISVLSAFVPRDVTFTKVDDVDSTFSKDTECLTFHEAVRTSVHAEWWSQSMANSEHRPVICGEVPNKFSASDTPGTCRNWHNQTFMVLLVHQEPFAFGNPSNGNRLFECQMKGFPIGNAF